MHFFLYKSLLLFFALVCALCWLIEHLDCARAAGALPPPEAQAGGKRQ
ncbi:MAG: hypothetical protein LBD02_07530 [Christensenellaceae bacterium]|jgi:hypothetical protein|nr:hypothetical protein [Christensenellaceae bacterium]